MREFAHQPGYSTGYNVLIGHSSTEAEPSFFPEISEKRGKRR
jgi:hypothetical protein